MNQITAEKKRLPKFQFTLRTLLLFCGLLSAVFGVVAARMMAIADVHKNVSWLEQQGVQVVSNFHDRYGLIPWQRNGKWRSILEWTVASPDDVLVVLTPQPKLPTIVDKLEGMSSIRRINMSGSAVTSEDVKRLARLPRLENLLLSGTPINDSDVDSLTKLSSIRSLDLSQTSISDAALARISTMKSLERVNLLRTNVSQEGLVTLQRLRPDLVVCPQSLDEAAPLVPMAVTEVWPFFDVQSKPG